MLKDRAPDSQDDSYTDILEERAHIMSLEGAYDFNRYFQLVEKGAYKSNQERTLVRGFTDSRTSLWVNRLNFHVDDRWNIGTEYPMLNQHTTNTLKMGILAELDINLTKFMQFVIGYNFTDFDDELRIGNDYDSKGWVFKVRGKY